MGKIENEHQLQVSRKAVDRLRRALAGYKAVPDPDPNCLDGIQFMMEKIEREIEEYLAQKANVKGGFKMESKKVTIELTNSEALVLFDFFARFNEHNDFLFEDPVEGKLLWDIESTLEKSLIEPLRSDYRLLVKQAREEVRNNE